MDYGALIGSSAEESKLSCWLLMVSKSSRTENLSPHKCSLDHAKNYVDVVKSIHADYSKFSVYGHITSVFSSLNASA